MDDCSLKILEQISLKVVEASPDAKIVINEKGEIVIFNTQAEFLFGYDREEVLGQSIEMLIPDNRHEIHRTHRIDYFSEPRTREMGTGQTLEGKHRNGSTFRVQIKLAPLIVSGAGVHALAVVRRVKNMVEGLG